MFSSDSSAVINIKGETEFTENSAGTNGGAARAVPLNSLGLE